ncbi:MAG: SEC-C domain-containing protein [Sulfuricella denitrificans]|nr:SEC-C domain-containing protein [Sulfuricella denitrificans]
MPDDEYEKLQQECMDVLPGAVSGIYNFWQARRKGTTVKRDTPKVGRNEPCPCGSGKKFKQCCGAERTLH